MEQTTQITTSRTSRGNKDRSGIRRRTGHYVRRRIGRCRARSTRGRTRHAGRSATDNGKTGRRQQDKKREHERQSRRTDTEKVNTPQRYEPGAGARPSPRKRRSIRSQAARANGKKAEEWQIWKQGEGWVKADTRRK